MDEGGKPKYPEKNPWGQAEDRQGLSTLTIAELEVEGVVDDLYASLTKVFSVIAAWSSEVKSTSPTTRAYSLGHKCCNTDGNFPLLPLQC